MIGILKESQSAPRSPSAERTIGRGSDTWPQGLAEKFTQHLRRWLASRHEKRHPLELEVAALRVALAEAQRELLSVRSSEKYARHLALHDEMTALPNRRFFRERMARALTNAQVRSTPMALVYLDLDGFKALNDTQGHAMGDEVLSIVGKRIAHALRAQDFVSRLGGDEYACLIEGVATRETLGHIAATLYQAISRPIAMGGSALRVYPSIGIAVYPADGLTSDALLKAADRAMYAAKQQKVRYACAALAPPEARVADLRCPL